jgi:hypothetical protein
MEVSGQLHAPATLLQGKSPGYPLDRRLGGVQSHSGHGGEEKHSQLCWELNPRILTVQPIAQRYTDWAELSKCIYNDKQVHVWKTI